MSQEEGLTFEAAYARLEQILEKMNSGKAALEEALKLYEEADHLISWCTKKLTEAEKRVECLVKNREGELVMDEQGKPQKQAFATSNQAPLKQTSVV